MTISDNRHRSLMYYMSTGVEFIVTFGIFLVAGLLLDRYLGTTPGFVFLGAAIGFALALRGLIRKGREANKEAQEAQDEDAADRES